MIITLNSFQQRYLKRLLKSKAELTHNPNALSILAKLSADCEIPDSTYYDHKKEGAK